MACFEMERSNWKFKFSSSAQVVTGDFTILFSGGEGWGTELFFRGDSASPFEYRTPVGLKILQYY